MRRILLVCLLVAIAPATLPAQTAHVRTDNPNLVGGELGGRGILYSINYERFFAPQFGLGAGIMGFGTSDGAVALVPLYLSLCPVGNVHSLYLSGGITLALGSDNWDELETTTLGTGAIGYLYQSPGGFYVRPTINIIFKGEDFLILPGVALGGSF